MALFTMIRQKLAQSIFITSAAVDGLAIVAVFIIVTRSFLLNIPEPLPGLGRLGDVLNSLALAYLAAWIFHLLVVQVPQLRNKQRVQQAVDPIMGNMAKTGTHILNSLANNAPQSVEGIQTSRNDQVPPVRALEELLSSIYLDDEAPLVIGMDSNNEPLSGTWWQYLEDALRRFDRLHGRLIPFYYYFDIDTVALLHQASECTFLSMIRSLSGAPIQLPPTSLSFLMPHFHEFLEICEEIEKRRCAMSL